MLKNFDNVACLFQRVFPKSVRCFSGIPADVIGEWMPQTWGLRPKRARKCRKKCGNGGGETRRMGLESAEVRHGNIRTFPFKHPYILTPTFEVPAEMPERPIEKGGAEVAFFRTFRRVLPDDGLPDALSVSGKGRKPASEKRRENIAHSPFSVPRRPRSVRLPAASVRRKSGILPECSPRAFYGCSARHLSPLWETLKKSTATLLTDCRTFKCMLSLPVMETQGFS